MLKGDELAQRVVRRDDFDLAAVKVAGDPHYIDRNRLAGRGKGRAVPHDEREVALAGAGGTQRITVHRRVGVGHGHQFLRAPDHRTVGVHHEFSGDVGTHHKRLDPGGEILHRFIPVGLVRVGIRAELFDGGQIAAGQDIQVEVFLPSRLVHKLPLEDEAAFGADSGVEIEALGEVRGQVREIRLALRPLSVNRHRQLAQSAGGGAAFGGLQREGFLPGRVVQNHGRLGAPVGVGGQRDGLLIEHVGTGLAANGRPAFAGDGEGLAIGQRRRVARPYWPVDNRQGWVGGGLAGPQIAAVCVGAQIGNDRLLRRLVGLRHPRPGKGFLVLIIKLQRDRIAARGRRGQLGRASDQIVDVQGGLGRFILPLPDETDTGLRPVVVGQQERITAGIGRGPGAIDRQAIGELVENHPSRQRIGRGSGQRQRINAARTMHIVGAGHINRSADHHAAKRTAVEAQCIIGGIDLGCPTVVCGGPPRTIFWHQIRGDNLVGVCEIRRPGRQGGKAGMEPAHGPEHVLAVQITEVGVRGIRAGAFGGGIPPRREIPPPQRHLPVVICGGIVRGENGARGGGGIGEAFIGPLGVARGAVNVGRQGFHGRSEHGQRHRGLNLLARFHHIVEHLARGTVFPGHAEGAHRRAVVGFRITQQHIRIGGKVTAGRRHVQVIPQRIRLAADHDGVFLIRVVAREGGVILSINGAFGLEARQAPTAGVVRQDDPARRIIGIGQRIVGDHRRPVNRLKAVDRIADRVGRIDPHPPDFQDVIVGNGIDGNDGACIGRGEPDQEGVLVGRVVVGSGAVRADPACQITHPVAAGLPGGGKDAGSDEGLLGEIPRGGVGRKPRDGGPGAADQGHVMVISAGVVGHTARLVEGELHHQAGRPGRISAGGHTGLQLIGRQRRVPDPEVVQGTLGQRVAPPFRFANIVVGRGEVVGRGIGKNRARHINPIQKQGHGVLRGIIDGRQVRPLVQGYDLARSDAARIRAGRINPEKGIPRGSGSQRHHDRINPGAVAEIHQPRKVGVTRHIDPTFNGEAASIEIVPGG